MGTAVRLLLCLMTTALAAAPGKNANIIPDGGFEDARQIVVAADKHIYDAIYKAGVDMGEDAPVVFLPSNFSQFCGCKRLQVVEGAPGKEVHTGKRALRLSGSFYLRATERAKTGDVFKATFYARGKGTARVILYLTDTDGRYFAQAVPNPAPVAGEEWRLVEQTLETKAYPNLAGVWARLETTGDVVLDDVSLVKAPRSAE